MAKAGAFAVVLELVAPTLAARITRECSIPTIGIGSGPDCDGQILVSTDLLGTFPWFIPKFVKPQLHAADQMKRAIRDWKDSLSSPS